MVSTRERVVNAVFPNRGAIANAATAMRDDRARARERAEAERAVNAARFVRPEGPRRQDR